MKLLLVIPPLLQFNCPYPSTAYLLNYLKKQKINVSQVDWSLDLIIKVFSRTGMESIFKQLNKNKNKNKTQHLKLFLKSQDEYEAVVSQVVAFLQGRVSGSIISKITSRDFLPEGRRFSYINQRQELLDDLFQDSLNPELDSAKFLASLFIDDISDIITEYVDPFWGLARYADKLAESMTSLNPLLQRLKIETVIDDFYTEIIEKDLKKFNPDIIGFSTPFPGNVYGALKGAVYSKKKFPKITTVMGGGYVNTELKFLTDARLFKMIDYLTFDDGEKPLELLVKKISNSQHVGPLLRTWCYDKKNKKILKSTDLGLSDVPFKDLDGPSYQGLDFRKYISMIEYPNPMMRYWTDYKWNKLIVAHGCYWKQCTFCDVSLDYIKRFEPASASKLVDQMQIISTQTKHNGFHFIDEAAPPVVLRAMAEEILKRNFRCEWWGNIRFDEAFTFEVAQKLAQAGLSAVSGGLEVASDRILKLIAKGVSIDKVARITHNFRSNNILVHAYLMYGFPTQTTQETIDSLEVVRQLFLNGCISSAYWHRFSATAHSAVGLNPEQFQIKLTRPRVPKEGVFAVNDLAFTEINNATDHDRLGPGLKKTLYNFQLGIGLDFNLQDWFDFPIPQTKIHQNTILKILNTNK